VVSFGIYNTGIGFVFLKHPFDVAACRHFHRCFAVTEQSSCKTLKKYAGEVAKALSLDDERCYLFLEVTSARASSSAWTSFAIPRTANWCSGVRTRLHAKHYNVMCSAATRVAVTYLSTAATSAPASRSAVMQLSASCLEYTR
jgi:hypothetical protein